MCKMARARRKGLLWIVVALLVLYCALIGLRSLYPIRFMESVLELAEGQSFDPALVASVIRVESRFRAGAISPRGAIGLMQIMPETGAWIAEKLAWSGFEPEQLLDPYVNLQFGTWYLRYLHDRFGDIETTLMAYNAGPTNAERWIVEPHEVFPETDVYVKRILDAVSVYRFYFLHPWIPRITPSITLSRCR